MTKAILFDLDGTITDSGEGIMNCVAYTFEKYGLPVPSTADLRTFVGPPLQDKFQEFGIPADEALKAVDVYRERYVPVGIYENSPYPGIDNLLHTLQTQGHRLFIATSKPEVMAHSVLDRFDLTKYFEVVAGATLDGTRDTKSDVIAYLLDQIGGISNAVMVGDTHYDVLGAAAHNIPCIGVSWGYGTTKQMQEAGAIAIADTMDELLTLINQ